MNKNFEMIFNAFAITFSLSQIESIIGILILVINLIMLIYNSIFKIITHIKNKDYKSIESDLRNLNDELDNFINNKKGSDKQ